MGPPWGAFCQITLTSCLNHSWSSWCDVYLEICFCYSLYFTVYLADSGEIRFWPGWLTIVHSVLWHCWLGHLTHKIILETSSMYRLLLPSRLHNSTTLCCLVMEVQECTVFQRLSFRSAHIENWTCMHLTKCVYRDWSVTVDEIWSDDFFIYIYISGFGI